MTDRLSLQNVLNAIMDQKKAEDVAARGQIGIGELAALLQAAPDYPVQVPFNGSQVGVGDVGSYRGYYSDLAIEPGGTLSAHALASKLKDTIGVTFEGYKGGEYVMSRNTPVWVSPYGDAAQLAVVGVEVGEAHVELIVLKEES